MPQAKDHSDARGLVNAQHRGDEGLKCSVCDDDFEMTTDVPTAGDEHILKVSEAPASFFKNG